MQDEILSKMREALINCDPKETARLVQQGLEQNIAPMVIMDSLVAFIREVGDEFGKGNLFLPELVGAAAAMERATTIIESAVNYDKLATQRKSIGVVVIGTVFGDVHTIGKSIVVALLRAEGFQVHDLGINVPTEEFINSVKNLFPDILAMSALLTTTAPEARKVIDQLKKEGIRDNLKIMVGGGAITDSFAKAIGADGYESTASGAVREARRLININGRV
jgi:methanogenic corrinoid protein MtbC1